MEEQNKQILIIDDDATVRKLIGFHLRNAGFKTLEAEGPEKGFELLKENEVNLVYCDVTMEGMDGFTFCRKVKEHEEYRLIPFVFVTAKNTMEDKSIALEAGGDDIITKPFDARELVLKARALLRRSEIFSSYAAKKSLSESFSQKTPHILIVDDDEALAKIFRHNLIEAGFECDWADSADNAFKFLNSKKTDLIISDIMMPKTDGYQFRKKLLEDKELNSIPFLFFTAKGNEEDMLEGFGLDIQDYVLKTAGPKVVVAKVTAILKRLGVERQKIVSELQSAAGTLRAKVVPDNYPQFDGYLISHWHVPYEGIPGGDFIDYFIIDDNTLAVVLGDVMGKKWGAWYFAFAYAGYVRSSIRVVLQNVKDISPQKILNQINKSVYQDAKVSEVFATLSVLIINNQTNVIKYSGAGDLPIFYRQSVANVVSRIKSKGMLLGFSSEGGYEDEEITMVQGDSVLLVTDGIIESRNSEGEQFNSGRIEKLLKSSQKGEEILPIVKSAFKEFVNNRYEDDISLIAITRK